MASPLERFCQASDEFALDIYNKIRQNKIDENIFLSPLSIQSALLLTYLGADGPTKSEIEVGLKLDGGFGGNEQELLNVYGEVLRVFVPSKDEDGNVNYELALANKAYVRKGLPVKSEFKTAIKDKLNGEVDEADFQNNLPSAVSEINSWVENQTHNKIKDLVSTESVTKDTAVVLVNAIYFKSEWLNQFDSDGTFEADFTNLNNSTYKVHLMHKKIFAKYTENDSFQLLMLPYKNNELSMIAILPKERNGLKALEDGLSASTLRNLSDNAEGMKVDVYLPKFKLEQSQELVEILQQLGIKQLFKLGANLSRMVTKVPVAVSGIIHKTFVEVDENGTEAAAATAMMFGITSFLPEDIPSPIFRADHPFLFAIRHEHTGLVAFVGRIGDLH